MPRSHQLVSVQIIQQVNKVSSARLAYLDGDPATGSFALSDDALFVPGNEVEILAGASDTTQTLFKGIIVQQRLRLRVEGSSQLIVDCRHAAVKMTIGRKSMYFHDLLDSAAIKQLAEVHGLTVELEDTAVTHELLVQYDCTDWDFALARADANGQVVLTNGDSLETRTPEMGDPVLSLVFGATILELDAEVDARDQFAGTRGLSWDPAEQALVGVDAADPGWTSPGNLEASALSAVAGLAAFDLRHPGLAADEAQAWADATQLRARVGHTRGRVMCEGLGSVSPGDVVTLEGVGERFSGDVYVTGVRHDSGPLVGWRTQIQFGSIPPRLPPDAPGVSAPAAGGLLGAASGLQVGVVVSNEDPKGEFRVRVRMPLVQDADDGGWARLATLDAGKERGTCFRPELGDEVVVGFLHGDPRHAVILGMVHSSANAAPMEGSDDNHTKGYTSRAGMAHHYDDDAVELYLRTPKGNKLLLSESEGGVHIEDENGNTVTLSSDGITLESASDLILKASGDITLEGTNITLSASAELKADGGAGAELTSSAIAKVKGSLVQIN